MSETSEGDGFVVAVVQAAPDVLQLRVNRTPAARIIEDST